MLEHVSTLSVAKWAKVYLLHLCITKDVRKAPKGAFKNVYQAAFFSNNAALFSISLIIFFNSKDNAKSLSNFVLKVILAILFPFMITAKWDDL